MFRSHSGAAFVGRPNKGPRFRLNISSSAFLSHPRPSAVSLISFVVVLVAMRGHRCAIAAPDGTACLTTAQALPGVPGHLRGPQTPPPPPTMPGQSGRDFGVYHKSRQNTTMRIHQRRYTPNAADWCIPQIPSKHKYAYTPKSVYTNALALVLPPGAGLSGGHGRGRATPGGLALARSASLFCARRGPPLSRDLNHCGGG